MLLPSFVARPMLPCAAESRAHVLLHFARYVGQPEHELGTIDPVCGRVAMFFHNHMHEGVPPVHGAHCGATILEGTYQSIFSPFAP